MTQGVRTDPKAIMLIETVKQYPELYKTDEINYNNLTRTKKQQLWDIIAKKAGYTKTDDAKGKWYNLMTYFREFLKDIARKKVRRYIPNTGNPNDKYMQLTDWRYYEHMKFMQPYIDIHKKRKTTTIKIITKDIQSTLENSLTTTVTPKNSIQNTLVEEEINELNSNLTKNVTNKTVKVMTVATPFEELSASDQNLKVFFNAMLRSTQRLPTFHQECIKRKLKEAIKRKPI